MFKTAVFLAASFCPLFSSVSFAAKLDKPALIAKVDEIVKFHARRLGIPGGAFGLMLDGEVIFKTAKGPRRLTAKPEIDSATHFQIGSITKTFTAALAVKLISQNKLKLDSLVKNYLPSRCVENRCKGITISHLLNHTSGIPSAGVNEAIEAGKSYEEVISKALNGKKACAPGQCFRYNNAAYELLKEVIEKVSAQPYLEILKTQLLTPLKLNDTGTTLADLKKTNNYFVPHLFRKGRYVETDHSTAYYSFTGSSALSSNLDDMLKWLSAELGNAPEILPLEFINLAQQPSTEAPDAISWFDPAIVGKQINSQYGFGHRILKFADLTVVFHSGWLKGCKTMMAIFPKRKLGFVLMQNSESDLGFRVLEDVARLLRSEKK